MRITILYFAAARERAGKSEESLELAPLATLGDAMRAIEQNHPDVAPLFPYLRWAVNQAFAEPATRLADGDTVVAIPPVAGGAARVALSAEPLCPRDVEALVAGPDHGGLVTFAGTVRDHTGDHRVERLEYEAYGPMALAQLEIICVEGEARWPGVRLAIHHRTGALEIGEAAVVIAASAAHRKEAFEACAWAIERVKADVPIWKREVRRDGSVWVGPGA